MSKDRLFIRDGINVYPIIKQFLRQMDDFGINIVLCSAQNDKINREFLKYTGLLMYFDETLGSDMKPTKGYSNFSCDYSNWP